MRIPADQYRPFLERVGTLCHVTYQEESSDNVSTAYYDAESRLVTQQTKLERLQNLLAQAENMEDIITIESAISDTELEIEQLTGTLRHYDSLVDFSTVYITLQEVYQLVQRGGAGHQLRQPRGHGLCLRLAGVCQHAGELGGGPGLRLGVAAASGGDRRGGGTVLLEAAPPADAAPGAGEEAVSIC